MIKEAKEAIQKGTTIEIFKQSQSGKKLAGKTDKDIQDMAENAY